MFCGITRGHKSKFLVHLFLLGISSVHCYLLFCFSFSETVQTVQLSCILWYKSNISYVEVQVLIVVMGQVHIPLLNLTVFYHKLWSKSSNSVRVFEVCFSVRLKQNCTVFFC